MIFYEDLTKIDLSVYPVSRTFYIYIHHDQYLSYLHRNLNVRNFFISLLS